MKTLFRAFASIVSASPADKTGSLGETEIFGGILGHGEPLRVDSVVFRYGKREILRGVSFEVPPGCVFAILGPNGSGKNDASALPEPDPDADVRSGLFGEARSFENVSGASGKICCVCAAAYCLKRFDGL